MLKLVEDLRLLRPSEITLLINLKNDLLELGKNKDWVNLMISSLENFILLCDYDILISDIKIDKNNEINFNISSTTPLDKGKFIYKHYLDINTRLSLNVNQNVTISKEGVIKC